MRIPILETPQGSSTSCLPREKMQAAIRNGGTILFPCTRVRGHMCIQYPLVTPTEKPITPSMHICPLTPAQGNRMVFFLTFGLLLLNSAPHV